MLHAQAYFDADHPDEAEIRDAASTRSTGASTGNGRRCAASSISMGWKPESGFIPHDWQGYNEAMLVVLLALGSPTHPVGPDAWTAWTEQLQGRLGPLHGLRAPELRAALRPPVLAPLDRFPRHPGRDHARARHRLFRELAPRRLRAARLRDRQSERLVRVRRERLGLHRLRRPGRDAPGRPHGARALLPRLLGARRRPRAHARRRHDRADRRDLVAAFRARDRHPRRRGNALALRRSTSIRQYGFLDSFNRSFTATDVPLADGRVDPGVRLGREGLPRHRPGPDPRDDLQLSQRARLGRHAQVRAAPARPRIAPGSPAAGSTQVA